MTSWTLPIWPQVEETIAVFLGTVSLLHPPIWNLSKASVYDASLHTMAFTSGKYLSIALVNRCLYCLGVTMVGSPLPAPPRNADSLTQLSSFLSQVYVRT